MAIFIYKSEIKRATRLLNILNTLFSSLILPKPALFPVSKIALVVSDDSTVDHVCVCDPPVDENTKRRNKMRERMHPSPLVGHVFHIGRSS